jgi:DHA1 family bicyclomycin/chloramphenicol resistance-like MFS transporter
MRTEYSLWLYIVVMSSLIMVGVFAMDSFMPALGNIARDFSVSEAVAQQTVSAYFLGYATLSLIIGPVADNIGRKRTILINNLVFLLATIACIFSPNINFLIAMRFIQGGSGGAIWTAGRIMTVEMFPEAKAKQAFGILAVVFSFGPAIAPIIGGWMVQDFSWAGSFYVMIFVSVYSTIAAILYLPETLNASSRQRFHVVAIFKNYGLLLGNRVTVIILSVIIFITAANYVYISSSHQFLVELLGLKPTQFAYLYWPLMVGNILAGLVNARFTYKINSRKVLITMLWVMAFAVITNVTLCFLGINEVIFLVMPLAVYAFGVGVALPVLMSELMKATPNLRGFSSALFSIGIFLANSLIAGFILPLIWSSTLNLALLQLVLLFGGLYSCILILKHDKS